MCGGGDGGRVIYLPLYTNLVSSARYLFCWLFICWSPSLSFSCFISSCCCWTCTVRAIKLWNRKTTVWRGEEGLPQLFLARATSKSSSFDTVFKSFQFSKKIIFFLNLATLGHKIWMDWSIAMIASCWNLQNPWELFSGKT